MERPCLVERMVFSVGVRSDMLVAWRGVAWVLESGSDSESTRSWSRLAEKVKVSSLELRGGPPSTVVTGPGDWLDWPNMETIQLLYLAPTLLAIRYIALDTLLLISTDHSMLRNFHASQKGIIKTKMLQMPPNQD